MNDLLYHASSTCLSLADLPSLVRVDWCINATKAKKKKERVSALVRSLRGWAMAAAEADEVLARRVQVRPCVNMGLCELILVQELEDEEFARSLSKGSPLPPTPPRHSQQARDELEAELQSYMSPEVRYALKLLLIGAAPSSCEQSETSHEQA